MALNVPTNVPSNALILLSVRAIITLINSPVGEFCAANPAYSLSKLRSTSNRAMAQMEGQRGHTGHDGAMAQLGGHRVGLKQPLQWLVLQDAQGGWRRRGEKDSFGCVCIMRSTKERRIWTCRRSRTFNNLTTPRTPSTRSEIAVMRRFVIRRYILCARTRSWPRCGRY